MSLEEKGWAVLEDGTALHKIAHRENLPCCTLCAMWALDVAHDVCENTVTRYAVSDLDWWKGANVYDPEKPWSALEAIQSKLGGVIGYVAMVSDVAPSLTPGAWHIVQRWRRLDLGDPGMEDDQVKNGSYGHTYLAYADKEGKGVTIIQSSIAKGYRVNKGTWEGNAGLKGFSVGVLTLPV
jgi:hypothetical protein